MFFAHMGYDALLNDKWELNSKLTIYCMMYYHLIMVICWKYLHQTAKACQSNNQNPIPSCQVVLCRPSACLRHSFGTSAKAYGPHNPWDPALGTSKKTWHGRRWIHSICNGILPSCAQTPQCALLVCLSFTVENGNQKPHKSIKKSHHEARIPSMEAARRFEAPTVDPSL